MASNLFRGLAPAGVFANNPAFSSALQQAAPTTNTLATLAGDLTGGKDLVELTSAMIFTNILHRLRLDNNRAYTTIKIVGSCLILAGGVYELVSNLSFVSDMAKSACSKIASYFTASVTVPANHTLNKDVLAWLASQSLGKDARTLTLDHGNANSTMDIDGEQTDDEDEQQGSSKRPLKYIPGFGQTKFVFCSHRMTMERKQAKNVYNGENFVKVEEGDVDPTVAQNITLTCFPTFRGAKPLKDLLEHVRGFSTHNDEPVVTVYTVVGSRGTFRWSHATRPARKLDGVVMESAKKTALVSDIEYYLSTACRKYYAARGIPYRRGYLAYGPPGTGKTSVAVALASHFTVPIFLLNMSGQDLDDKNLEDLFSQLPQKSILLLEDVDSAGLQREQMASPDAPQESEKGKAAPKKGVTLSGLLNALDGPASVDGRILIMTSNSPDSLDAALVRPGRCDVKVLFGYVTPEVSSIMFSRIYTKTPEETFEGETNVAETMDIPAMATLFAAQIPLDAPITPAEAQAWLLVNRQDPQQAIDGAKTWAEGIIENKRRGANVASFTNEIDRSGIPTVRKDSAMMTIPPALSPMGSEFSFDEATENFNLEDYM